MFKNVQIVCCTEGCVSLRFHSILNTYRFLESFKGTFKLLFAVVSTYFIRNRLPAVQTSFITT